VNPSILLLDCSEEIFERLKKQGHDVQQGSIGFVSGVRSFPTALYEKNVFVYDPAKHKQKGGSHLAGVEIQNKTPEFSISEMESAILGGGVFLCFLRPLANDTAILNRPYRWIPSMPLLSSTKDSKVTSSNSIPIFAPLIRIDKLKLPVEVAIQSNTLTQAMFSNYKSSELGAYYKLGNGLVILLPNFVSNDHFISVFLNRILPKIRGMSSQLPLIEELVTEKEKNIEKEIEALTNDISEKEKKLDNLRETLEENKRMKAQTIKDDETGALVLSYMDLATNQPDPLFYLYKITEALEKRFKSEKLAKEKLNCSVEFNFINRLANATFADVRHTPDPGEQIKEVSEEDLEKCFSYAKKIMSAYFSLII